jgi:cytochrome oxidase Cu insertion factor (SCO1/SenC/PrrC family)
VSRLATLQTRARELGLDGVRIAALTYDPAYDTPALMKTYGVNRGFRFDARSRFLRVDGNAALERVRSFFELGVSYAEGIVSQHRIELSVLGADGRIAARFDRLQWNEDLVLSEVERALSV